MVDLDQDLLGTQNIYHRTHSSVDAQNRSEGQGHSYSKGVSDHRDTLLERIC